MQFSKILNNWYIKNKRNFPWRNTNEPYLIWLSEIILQQTRTAQGLPYYLAFKKTFPTVYHLANANQTKVLKLWQGLGYYSRARNLHFTAQYIVNNLSGVFPTNYKDLMTLKGVGDYTASAIASICYEEKTAVVDGNVYRFLSRYFGINSAINSASGKKEFKLLAQKLLPQNNIGLHNQAIMDFGSIICKPQKPKCNTCTFSKNCVALMQNTVANLPYKQKKTNIKKRFFNYIIPFTINGQTILNKRINKDIWFNLFEFPLEETTSEINKKELIRTKTFQTLIKNSNDIEIKLFNKKIIIHKLSHQHIHTKFWVVYLDFLQVKTIKFKQITKYPVSTLVHNFYIEFDNLLK